MSAGTMSLGPGQPIGEGVVLLGGSRDGSGNPSNKVDQFDINITASQFTWTEKGTMMVARNRPVAFFTDETCPV